MIVSVTRSKPLYMTVAYIQRVRNNKNLRGCANGEGPVGSLLGPACRLARATGPEPEPDPGYISHRVPSTPHATSARTRVRFIFRPTSPPASHPGKNDFGLCHVCVGL